MTPTAPSDQYETVGRPTLAAAALAVFETDEAAAKARGATRLAEDWRARAFESLGRVTAPERPGRPERPRLVLGLDLRRGALRRSHDLARFLAEQCS